MAESKKSRRKNHPFYWPVNKTGYRLESLEAGTLICKIEYPLPDVTITDSMMNDPQFVESLYCHRQYQPMAASRQDLYREFALLQQTPESILQFANNYGLLGLQNGLKDMEGLEEWYSEIRKLKKSVQEYDYINERNYDELRKDFILGRLNRKDVFSAAKQLLRLDIRRKLERQISPDFIISNDGNPNGLIYEPSSLIGALWLQLAMEVAGMLRKKCIICGGPIPMDSKEGHIHKRQYKLRSDALYCSPACKQTAYRMNKTAGNIKKTIAISKALDQRASQAGIDLSAALQEILKSKLGLSEI